MHPTRVRITSSCYALCVRGARNEVRLACARVSALHRDRRQFRGSMGSDGFEKVLIGTRGARETFLRFSTRQGRDCVQLLEAFTRKLSSDPKFADAFKRKDLEIRAARRLPTLLQISVLKSSSHKTIIAQARGAAKSTASNLVAIRAARTLWASSATSVGPGTQCCLQRSDHGARTLQPGRESAGPPRLGGVLHANKSQSLR